MWTVLNVRKSFGARYGRRLSKEMTKLNRLNVILSFSPTGSKSKGWLSLWYYTYQSNFRAMWRLDLSRSVDIEAFLPPLISSADHSWERKWTLSSKLRTECLQEKFWPFFNVFPSGLFPSGRPSLISWLFTESRDAWGLLEEKQTSIENICCRKFSTSLIPPSPHHCVSPSWSLKVCVDWRGWTSKLQEAEVTSTMSLQGLVTS